MKRCSVILSLVFVLVLGSALDLFAQFGRGGFGGGGDGGRGRGGFGGGGRGGRGGFSRGGDRGGGRSSRGGFSRAGGRGGSSRAGSSRGGRRAGSSRGGRRGGSSRGGGGGDRSSRMRSFIQRMDTNGNGKIEPSEAQGRSSFMLQRMGVSVTKSISVDALAKQVSDRSGGGRGGRGSSTRSGSSRGGSRGRGRTTQSSEPPPPEFDLVPGFGVEDDGEFFPPVLAFGVRDELYEIKTSAADRKEADRILRQYDKNKDRALDKEEMKRIPWRSDPWQHDRNRDGRISADELAMRYSLRRTGKENIGRTKSSLKKAKSNASRRSRTSSRTSSRGGRGRGSSSSSGDRSARMVQMMFPRYDRNKNGYLDKDELGSVRFVDTKTADKNRDGKLSKKEFADAMAARMTGGGRRGRGRGRSGAGGGGGNSRWFTRNRSTTGPRTSSTKKKSSTGKLNDAETYKRLSVLERLEKDGLQKDLPEWFTQSDKNEDGQIKMAEFASSWNDEAIRDFFQFDKNKDGIITAQECIAAKEAGAVRGVAPAASTASSSASRSRSSRSSSRNSRSRSRRSSSSPRKKLSKAKLYMSFAVGQIKLYDKNKDGVLSKDEWSAMKNKPAKGADADGDGKLTPTELANALAGGK